MDGNTSAPAAPAPAPAQTNTPTTPAHGQPRSPDGRYANAQPTAQQPVPAQELASAPWKRSFSVKSKSGGSETVEVDEAAVIRALSFEREGHFRLKTLNQEREHFSAEQKKFQAEQKELGEALADPARLRALIDKRAPDAATARRWRAMMVRDDMQDHNLSPEQRELQELRRLKAQREMEDAQRKEREDKEATEARLQAAAEKVRPRLEKLFTDVMDIGGLPKTTSTMEAVASAWQRSKENGIDLEPAELAAYVKHEMDGQLDARLSDPALTDDELFQRYPALVKRFENAFRARIIARRKVAGAAGSPPLNREGPSITSAGSRPTPRVRSADEDRILSRGGTPPRQGR